MPAKNFVFGEYDKSAPLGEYFKLPNIGVAWTHVFKHLKNEDVNNCNLTCRYFNSLLNRYPPEDWRVLKLTSVDQRNAKDMTEFSSWQRYKNIKTLEVGVAKFGCMLQDEDLVTILNEIQLSTLKLIYCQMVHIDENLENTKYAKNLTTFAVHGVKPFFLSKVVENFPNLTQLGISFAELKEESEDKLGKSLSKCKLQRLGIYKFRSHYCQSFTNYPIQALSCLKGSLVSLHLRIEELAPTIQPFSSLKIYELIKSLPKLRFFFTLFKISDLSAHGPLGVVEIESFNLPPKEAALLYESISRFGL